MYLWGHEPEQFRVVYVLQNIIVSVVVLEDLGLSFVRCVKKLWKFKNYLEIFHRRRTLNAWHYSKICKKMDHSWTKYEFIKFKFLNFLLITQLVSGSNSINIRHSKSPLSKNPSYSPAMFCTRPFSWISKVYALNINFIAQINWRHYFPNLLISTRFNALVNADVLQNLLASLPLSNKLKIWHFTSCRGRYTS